MVSLSIRAIFISRQSTQGRQGLILPYANCNPCLKAWSKGLFQSAWLYLKNFPFRLFTEKTCQKSTFFFVIEKKLLKLVNWPKGLNKRKFRSSKKAFQPLTETSAGKSTFFFRDWKKTFKTCQSTFNSWRKRPCDSRQKRLHDKKKIAW